jgi:hypothetical protein
MGTEITLEIAGMTLDYSKNFKGTDHGALFQSIDRKRIRCDQIDYAAFEESGEDFAPVEMGFTRKFTDMLPRLDLLGFTRGQAQLEYLRAVEICREEAQYDDDGDNSDPRDIMSFDEFCAFVSAHPVEDLDNTFDAKKNDEQIKRRFSGGTAAERLPRPLLDGYNSSAYSERSYFGEIIGFLHPYSVLRVLGENAQNQEADVVWQYGPLVENGWAKATEFTPDARRHQTFLIATEGSSDAYILKHAISILRPKIDDFFRFIDVKEGHPFPGAGNLVKFAEGLAKIDVHNQVVFLFDNDGEGFDAWRRITSVPLPANMRAIMLPELDQFRSFPARGPQGVTDADINRSAAAIECYLDLNNADAGSAPQVVWTNYKKDLGIYHGSLEDKEIHVKAFLRQTAASIAAGAYDASKIRAVLDALVVECCSIAERRLRDEA